MLSKKFKSDKFYEVTRYVFKYGNEGDEMDASTTVWDSKEKALAYIDRYATGLKFAAAYMEKITVDREITADDYKKNQYNLVSSQEIYFQNYDGIYEELTEPIYYYKQTEEKSEHTDETVEETSAPAKEQKVYKVYGYARRFDDLTECEKFAEKISKDERRDITILSEIIGASPKTEEVKMIRYTLAPPKVAPDEPPPDESNRFIDVKIIDEPNEKDFIFTVGGYSVQFRKLKDAIKWTKKWAREQNKDLTIYKRGVAVCRVRAKPQRTNKIKISV